MNDRNFNLIGASFPAAPLDIRTAMAEVIRRLEAGENEGIVFVRDGQVVDGCGCEAGCCAGEAAAAAAELPCQAMSDDELVGVIAGAQPVTHGDRVLHAYADPAILIGSLTRAAEDFAAGFATVARLSQQLLADEI